MGNASSAEQQQQARGGQKREPDSKRAPAAFDNSLDISEILTSSSGCWTSLQRPHVATELSQ